MIEKEVNNIKEGKNGDISDNLSYEVIKIEEKNSFLDSKLFEFDIKFSDEKKGKICYSKGDKSFFILYGRNRAYYINKEAALKGLYYYLSNNKVLEQDRHYCCLIETCDPIDHTITKDGFSFMVLGYNGKGCW